MSLFRSNLNVMIYAFTLSMFKNILYNTSQSLTRLLAIPLNKRGRIFYPSMASQKLRVLLSFGSLYLCMYVSAAPQQLLYIYWTNFNIWGVNRIVSMTRLIGFLQHYEYRSCIRRTLQTYIKRTPRTLRLGTTNFFFHF